MTVHLDLRLTPESVARSGQVRSGQVRCGQYQLLVTECAQAPHGVPYPALM